jgi:hypothetical protein
MVVDNIYADNLDLITILVLGFVLGIYITLYGNARKANIKALRQICILRKELNNAQILSKIYLTHRDL